MAPMQASALAIITMRRELAARYARMTRLWLAAHHAYRRLHAAPVKNLTALRDAAQRLEQLHPRAPAPRPGLKAPPGRGLWAARARPPLTPRPARRSTPAARQNPPPPGFH